MRAEDLGPELRAKALACKTSEELLAPTKEECVELPDGMPQDIAGGFWTYEDGACGIYQQYYPRCQTREPCPAIRIGGPATRASRLGWPRSMRGPTSMCRHCNNEALTVAPWERSALDAGEWLAGA